MAINTSSWLVIIFASVVLYGGLLYFTLIAVGRRPEEVVPLLGHVIRIWRSGIQGRAILALGLASLLVVAGSLPDVENIRKTMEGSEIREKVVSASIERHGTTRERETTVLEVDLKGYQVYAIWNLTWRDEPDRRFQQNQPDRFRLNVTSPDGIEREAEGENSHGEEGHISLEFSWSGFDDSGGATWTVRITCEEAGDQTSIIPGYNTTDSGNDWTLECWYKYRME